MERDILIALFNNAALLLVLSVAYEVTYFLPSRYRRVQPILSGIFIALICSAVMIMPFRLQSGIIFDTRSIIISVTALMFGLIPTAITVVVAAIVRFIIGGSGTVPGLTVILTSALIGLAWRRWLYPPKAKMRWLNFYVMSISVHVVMLACMLMLPYPDSLNVIRAISLPVMLIYPIVTILLIQLLMRKQTLRLTQDQLKQSEERFKLLFDKAPLGYQSLDYDGFFINVNQQWCDLLGYSRDEVVGKWFGDFLAPETRDAFLQRFPKFRSDGHVKAELKVLHKNGTPIFILLEGNIAHDFDGAFKQTHCILQDISSQKAAEAALAESEKKYRYIAENISDVVWQADLNMNTTYISPSVEGILGESTNENNNWNVQEKFPEQMLNKIRAIVYEETEKDPETTKNRSRTIEFEHHKIDGAVGWIEMNISILRDINDIAVGFISVSRDITQRKLAELALKESERSKSLLLSNLPGMAYRCNYDREWTMQFGSNGCAELTGYTQESLINNRDLSYKNLITPKYRELVWSELEKAISNRLPYKCEYEITTADGECKWVLEMGEGVYNEKSEIEALEGIILDISDRKKAEDQLKKSLENTQAMINNHEAVMLLIEPLSGEILEANRSATIFYGYTKEEILNMTIQDLNALEKDEVAALRIKALNNVQKYFTAPHRLKNGEIKIVDVYSSPIDFDGKKVIFSIIFDATKREEIAKQNEFLAYHDYLTGLYNRRFFEEEYARRVKRGEFPVAILLGDIDGFKVINDSFGHAEGDRILKVVATTINNLISDKDVLTRIGGDEFAVIVSEKNAGEIRQYLDKVERVDYEECEETMGQASLSISWGYAVQTNIEDTIDALTEEAEAYMYNRKFYSHKSARSKTVDVIMETLFAKSDREKQHSERVSKLCEAVAQKMGLSKAAIDKVRVAGLLHDIGKIGIDENVLNKAGKLDEKEWELMKLHSAKGASILENTNEYHDISDIVLSHHEHYDGSGYPRGLKSKSIPLWARIIAVADTFDAMTNTRSYRNAVSNEEVVAELKKCSGTQFDPQIVEVFIQIINEQGNS